MSERTPRDVDDRLADWVDDRLSDKERERFIAELRVNAQLREDLERYERTVGVVRAALRAPAPPAGIADRVMAAIAAPPSAPPRRWTLQRVGLCLAAAAAVLATAVWIDAWTPASPSSQDTAAVDRLRDGADVPVVETRDEERAAGKQDAGNAAEPKPVLEGLQAVEESSEAKSVSSARAPAAPAPIKAPAAEPSPPEVGPAREQAEAGSKEAPANKPVTQPQSSAGPGVPIQPYAPVTGGVAGPTTGGPGAPPTGSAAAPTRSELHRAAGADRSAFAEAERADAPVPLLVVEGLALARASDDEKAEVAKDRRTRGSAPLAGGGGNKSGEATGDAKAGETKPGDAGTGLFLGAGLDGAALHTRIDAFLAGAATASTPPAAIGWTTVRGELRLSPMVEESPPDAAPRPAGSTAGQPAIVRTWLVEGTRADLEVLLARLAFFTKEHQLTTRADETKAPVEKRASDKQAAERSPTESDVAAAKPEVDRMVLRFRLRPR